MSAASGGATSRGQARLATLVLAGALAGAAAGAARAAPPDGGTLNWGVETEPTTLNPQLNGQAKAELILRASFESLLARRPDGSYVPWLASAYQVSPDGRTLRFTLREDVSFSDGRRLDAAAVAANFTKMRDPAYCAQSPYCGIASRLVEARALDPRTVQLTLAEAYAPFLSFAASLKLISPAAYASPQLRAGGREVAGTGPFVLAAYRKGQQIEFVRNPNYHWAPATLGHQGPAYLERVIYRFLPESSVRTGALLSGQVDVIEGVSGNDAALIERQPTLAYLRAFNTGAPFSLYLNTTYGPTRDPRVRQALLQGLDLGALVAAIYRGKRARGWGIASPVDPLYDRSIEHAYGNQPALANRLLDQAGWSGRDAAGYRTRLDAAGRPERLTIDVMQAQATLRDQRDVLMLGLQAQARQRLGIALSLRTVDAGSYVESRKAGRFGAIPNSNTDTDGIDIENHYLPVEHGGVINYSRADDPRLSVWLREAAQARDEATRKAIYARLQRVVIVEQADAIPLYQPEDQIAASRRVSGLAFRSFKQMPETPYDVRLAPL
ncbi:ABC transporter substrate-binding protein [Burkholderia gladioli]|uniref:ABC transporter substrate-binding protein n=1 Tax=Burkholderia gladioli TaxID=28095 RepID=UPI00163F7CFE|nr:ABC transporter substrate-binding protein [Burkholderia gladioli]